MKSQASPPLRYILTFDSARAASLADGLALAGGKGANLARLSQAGFPVPAGFVVATPAYDDFVRANRLEACIQAALSAVDSGSVEQLEAASAGIRAAFAAGRVSEDLAAELRRAYRSLGGAVAVRSSATAEDLPEMSFAGQQDTYLNVLGEEALLAALVDCWSSLWTARAIGYRLRNRVSQVGLSLAVVVQKMVASRVSGVLFSANPLSGLRSQTVIDAVFGLGEALVSGKVEPDHYVVDGRCGEIVEKTLGEKTLSIHGQAGGGVARREEPRKGRQALADEDILALARLGQQAAGLFGGPQDIEWAQVDDGRLYLLQSRPVTSLYPLPQGVSSGPLLALFSFGAVQGMLDPLTPLGRDSLRTIFAVGAGLFGIRVSAETQTVLYEAGERLWIDVTPLLRNTLGRRAALAALQLVEPSARQALLGLLDEPQLQPGRAGVRPRTLVKLGRFFIPLAFNLALNLAFPDGRRKAIVERGERIIDRLRVEASTPFDGSPRRRLAWAAGRLSQTAGVELPGMFVLFISGVASAMSSFTALRVLAQSLPEESGVRWTDTVLELTRGLSYNPTTEMDLELWELARAIRGNPPLLAEFQSYDAHALALRYLCGEMSPDGQELVGRFLARYGGRGLGEIDLGRPRWSEDPAHIFEMLSSYLQITDPEQAPDVVFARGPAAAQAALERLCAALRPTRGGWLKARQARFFAGRMRRLMGMREAPKFFAVRLMALERRLLLQAGEALVQAGELERPDDPFYLTFGEIEAFAAGEPPENEPAGWRGLIAARRALYRREKMRRQIPRVLLSDGRAFFEGIAAPAAHAGSLFGSPVSPGSAEGHVRVVFDPRRANLSPGEILVCPGTDPSWTPLFLSAAGLVMEVGGMMTHGAVVAREYGIPAIVGVSQATLKLKTGQRIRMDGSSGRIAVLEEAEAGS